MLGYYIAFFHHDEILRSVKGRFLFRSRQTGSRVSRKETKDGSGHTFLPCSFSRNASSAWLMCPILQHK